jgi:hypothetical protein
MAAVALPTLGALVDLVASCEIHESAAGGGRNSEHKNAGRKQTEIAGSRQRQTGGG